MKKKISLNKLDLKINKINDLKTNKITGGKAETINCPVYPPPVKTNNYPGVDTSVAICWC